MERKKRFPADKRHVEATKRTLFTFAVHLFLILIAGRHLGLRFRWDWMVAIGAVGKWSGTARMRCWRTPPPRLIRTLAKVLGFGSLQARLESRLPSLSDVEGTSGERPQIL